MNIKLLKEHIRKGTLTLQNMLSHLETFSAHTRERILHKDHNSTNHVHDQYNLRYDPCITQVQHHQVLPSQHV